MQTLFNRDFFKKVNERRALYDWAEDTYQSLRKHTEGFIEAKKEIPLTGGGWSHDYCCPNEGARLHMIDMHHHRCPSCGAIWSGSPWDDVAVSQAHGGFSQFTLNAALLYGITGEERFADWAKSNLLFYGEHYEQYPLHDRHGGSGITSGKIQCQTLSEASWIIAFAKTAYILKQLDALTEEEITMLGDRFFLPAVQVIAQNPKGISNWQSYHNAAKAWIAAAIGSRDMLEEVIREPENGFLFQMENSLAEDGFWYEGAWGYHFYTMEAQTQLILAALAFGEKLYDHPRFQAMFRAPLACMFPDRTLPAVHDSSEVSVDKYAPLFEISLWLWNEGGDVVLRNSRRNGNALLFGVPADQVSLSSPDAPFSTMNLGRSGMLFVRTNTPAEDTAQSVMIDYGEHGGEHGHQDKLNLLYFAKGFPWLDDAGTVPYGNPMYKGFYKHTIAHNTVAIGGKSQAAAEGTIKSIRSLEDNALEVVTEVEGTYPGVHLQRKFILTESLLIDFYHVVCDTPETVDWIINTQGYPVEQESRSFLPAEPEALGKEDGYGKLYSVRKLEGSSLGEGNPWTMEWEWRAEPQNEDSTEDRRPEKENHRKRRLAETHMHESSGVEPAATGDRFELYTFGVDGETVYLAESPALPSIRRRSTLIRRSDNVKDVLFATVFRACRQGDSPLQVSLEESANGEPAELIVTGEDGKPIRFSAGME